MRTVLLIVCASLWAAPVFAQQWRKVNQAHYGMKYKLPKSWAIDGFGADDYWDDYGSSVCDCAGTINIGNRFDEDELYMVAYPMKDANAEQAAKRNFVWEMEFDPEGEKSEVKTGKLTFEKTSSRWKEGTEGNYPGSAVWRLTTEKYGQRYVLYFWAKPEVMQENEGLILKILESFTPVEKK